MAQLEMNMPMSLKMEVEEVILTKFLPVKESDKMWLLRHYKRDYILGIQKPSINWCDIMMVQEYSLKDIPHGEARRIYEELKLKYSDLNESNTYSEEWTWAVSDLTETEEKVKSYICTLEWVRDREREEE